MPQRAGSRPVRPEPPPYVRAGSGRSCREHRRSEDGLRAPASMFRSSVTSAATSSGVFGSAGASPTKILLERVPPLLDASTPLRCFDSGLPDALVSRAASPRMATLRAFAGVAQLVEHQLPKLRRGMTAALAGSRRFGRVRLEPVIGGLPTRQRSDAFAPVPTGGECHQSVTVAQGGNDERGAFQLRSPAVGLLVRTAERGRKGGRRREPLPFLWRGLRLRRAVRRPPDRQARLYARRGAEHEPPVEDGRGCVYVEEMLERGWERNERGRWSDPARHPGARLCGTLSAQRSSRSRPGTTTERNWPRDPARPQEGGRSPAPLRYQRPQVREDAYGARGSGWTRDHSCGRRAASLSRGPKIATRSATTPKTDRLVCTNSILRDSSIPDHAHALLSYLRACGRRAPTRNEISRDVPCLDNDAITDAWKRSPAFDSATSTEPAARTASEPLAATQQPRQTLAGEPRQPPSSRLSPEDPWPLQPQAIAARALLPRRGSPTRRRLPGRRRDRREAPRLGNNPHTGKKIVGRERRRLLDEGVIVELRTAKRYGGAGIYGFADDLHGDERGEFKEHKTRAFRTCRLGDEKAIKVFASVAEHQTIVGLLPDAPPETLVAVEALHDEAEGSGKFLTAKDLLDGPLLPADVNTATGFGNTTLGNDGGTGFGNAGGTRFGNDGGTAAALPLLPLSPRSRFAKTKAPNG